MEQQDYVDKFSAIFKNNAWGSEESVSGPGSEIAATALLRTGLVDFIRGNEISSIFDAPCGDFNWMQALTREVDIDYLGGDIVADLIETNTKDYGDDLTRFVVHDLIEDRLPTVDFLLVRDCFIHFSNAHVWRVIEQFLKSETRFIGLTTMVDHPENTDIKTGQWRLINLEIAPFDLPQPRLFIDDDKNDLRDKKIGIWDRQQLLDAVAGR